METTNNTNTTTEKKPLSKGKLAWKIIKYVLIGILLLVAAIEVHLVGSKLINPQSQPKFFGLSKAVVLTDSMQPDYKPNDLLYYVQQDSYAIGDDVIYSDASGTLVTHRIVRINDDGTYGIQGIAIANATIDDVAIQNIHGKVFLCIPSVGALAKFLTSPWGIVIIVLIIAMIFLFPYLLKWVKGEDKDVETEGVDNGENVDSTPVSGIDGNDGKGSNDESSQE